MLQFLSFALFSTVLFVAIASIVTTVKAEMPYVRRALGIEPASLPRLHVPRTPRVRVTRPATVTDWIRPRVAA